jgi:hypothetical protein
MERLISIRRKIDTSASAFNVTVAKGRRHRFGNMCRRHGCRPSSHDEVVPPTGPISTEVRRAPGWGAGGGVPKMILIPAATGLPLQANFEAIGIGLDERTFTWL